MSSIIKNFKHFHFINEEDSFWGNLVGSIGGGVKNVAVGEVTDILLKNLGIKPNTFGGTIIRNMVQSLDLSEYPKFIMGKVQVKDLAPKLADATIATLTDLGVEGVATRLLKMDEPQRDGLVYKMIKEMISNEASKKEFRNNLVGIWTWILGGGSPSASNQPSPFGVISSQDTKPNSQMASSKTPTSWESILGKITGGESSPSGRGNLTGQ